MNLYYRYDLYMRPEKSTVKHKSTVFNMCALETKHNISAGKVQVDSTIIKHKAKRNAVFNKMMEIITHHYLSDQYLS